MTVSPTARFVGAGEEATPHGGRFEVKLHRKEHRGELVAMAVDESSVILLHPLFL